MSRYLWLWPVAIALAAVPAVPIVFALSTGRNLPWWLCFFIGIPAGVWSMSYAMRKRWPL